MHFSKTYTQLLLTLPPDLRENAIEYRQLKKLIKQVVEELVSLGLRPSLLQHLLGPRDSRECSNLDGFVIPGLYNSEVLLIPEVAYELLLGANPIESQLRLRLKKWPGEFSQTGQTHTITLHSLHHPFREINAESAQRVSSSPNLSVEEAAKEIVIPLLSDTAFFMQLSTALQSLSSHLADIPPRFVHSLKSLSREISLTARPASSSSEFQPYSATSNASLINVSSPLFSTVAKTDLYAWREIFHQYAEAEVFKSGHELDRGERSVEESEVRLKGFADRVTQQELTNRFKFKQSQAALEVFLDLNMYILNVKKFQIANAEAARKILKKHTKRTALPPPEISQISLVCGAAVTDTSTSLPRILVQAIEETLFPLIPHVDDYSCVICTSIAFKPVRLFCAHLFCVRCLVKMQKRGQDHCPICRAPAVLKADRSNVDWALVNFMQDWFPEEAEAKQKNNEKEAAKEQLQELGLDTGCVIE